MFEPQSLVINTLFLMPAEFSLNQIYVSLMVGLFFSRHSGFHTKVTVISFYVMCFFLGDRIPSSISG